VNGGKQRLAAERPSKHGGHATQRGGGEVEIKNSEERKRLGFFCRYEGREKIGETGKKKKKVMPTGLYNNNSFEEHWGGRKENGERGKKGGGFQLVRPHSPLHNDMNLNV